MTTKISFILGILLIGITTNAQQFDYSSLSVFGQSSILSNYRTIPIQQKVFFSGGLDYSISYDKNINLKIGAQYLETYINNDKQKHSICDQPDNSCWAESEMKYINLPIGVEFYSNKSNIKTKSYYNFKLVPMFSVQDLLIKTEFLENKDGNHLLTLDSLVNNRFKFQDLHIEFSIGTEISITDQYKIYFEPSVQHSMLFRTEDLRNPNYMISFRLGLRMRSQKE
jgi:hypothetical protein